MKGVGAARGLALGIGLLLGGCARASAPHPEFGFQVYYEEPQKRPDDRCGWDNGGPTSSTWMEGPHARFEESGPKRLALESLAWFENAPEAATWRENSTARLELLYPSHALKITARYVPGLDLSWDEQLRSWFERFPPGGERFSELTELGREHYSWSIDFGDSGKIHGIAASDSTALEGMKALLSTEKPSPIFRQPSFSLTLAVRRSSHVMDCYSVDVDAVDAGAPEQLDQLPLRLREKRAQYARD